MKPLKAAAETDKPIISKVDIKLIFNPIEGLLTVNSAFLADLEAVVNSWTNESEIGMLFMKHVCAPRGIGWGRNSMCRPAHRVARGYAVGVCAVAVQRMCGVHQVCGQLRHGQGRHPAVPGAVAALPTVCAGSVPCCAGCARPRRPKSNLKGDLPAIYFSACLCAQDLMTNPECDRLEVNDHLILPVQRVTRYVLLLQDLLKNTETTHPDYGNIVQALDMVRRLSAEVNEAKRKEESMTKLFQIQKEVENCPVRLRPTWARAVHVGHQRSHAIPFVVVAWPHHVSRR